MCKSDNCSHSYLPISHLLIQLVRLPVIFGKEKKYVSSKWGQPTKCSCLVVSST